VYSIGENLITASSAKKLALHIGMADVLSTQKIHDESRSNDLNNAPGRNYSVLDRSSSLPYSDSAIAVTGMACKFAGADSLEQFWKILETGATLCRDLPNDRFPDSRFERRAYPKNFKANTIDDVDAFDHKFFKVASREAAFMDPQQRLALQVTYQALESADYFGRNTSETEQDMGCYFATCTNEYHENVACHPPSAFSLTGSIRPFIAGKVSHHFGWTGPAIMLDTACSASGTAIHQACRAVATGECSSAVAGATNIFVSPDTFQDLASGHFISTTGASKSFDAAADGYCRGEGVAVIVLKKLSTALRDGDPIQGVIASTAVNQNANESSITIPHAPSQMKLYRKALQLAGLDAQDISYVEAHGTGTPVGDPIEAESIRGVFGNPSRHHQHGKTYLGSLKSNIGHTEGSSGISGLIKVLLMMQKGIIPQQALFNNLNPAIAPLEPSGIEIPTSNVSWTSRFKAACVNNYGASGTNAVMVVTQPPNVISSLENTPIATYPVSITAFSPSSLASYCSALLEFINQTGSNDLAMDIFYHLSRRKNLNLSYSVCAAISSLQELKDLLISTVSGEPRMKENKQRPVVLFFDGQTGKTASVPRAFYDSFAIFRKHLDSCDTTLRALGAPSIFPAIFEPGPHDDVVLSHSTLFSTQYASAMAWLDCGLQPARLVGHSFGQFTALCISGVFSLQDSLRLVTERALLIRERWGKDPGSMIAIEADPDKVLNLLTQHAYLGLEIACYNGPQSFVLAGSTSSTNALEAFLKSSPQPLQWKRLQITNAFHSALTEPLVRPLQDTAERLNFQNSKIPLETCSKDSTWQPVTPVLVASHTREPVYFHQAVERISEQLGPCTWLEAGSGSGAPMLRRALGTRASSHEIKSLTLNSASSLRPLAEVTAELWKLGLGIQFWPFHQSQQHQYGVLNLPPYQFDKSRHWLDWKELATPAVEAQHPVPEQTPFLQLVRKTKDGGEFQINTQCESWQRICSEHRTLGVSICPVSLLLDSISKAIDTIRYAPTRKTGVYDIQNLATQSPIPAKSENGLTLTIGSANHPQSWTFVVSKAPNSRNVYASGTVSASNERSGGDFARFERLVDTTHIKNLTNDAESDSVKGKAVYRSFTDLFQVPKSRQGIREVSVKGNEAAGYLMPLSNSPFVAIENVIQIPLLCLNSLRDRQYNEIYINTAMGHAKFKGSPDLSSDKNISWAVYLKFFRFEGLETCDIFVFDVQSEQLSAIILDVTFTRVQIESLRQTLGVTIACLQPTASRYSDSSEAFKCAEPCALRTQNPDSSIHDRMSMQSTDLPDLTKALFNLLVRVADLDVGALRNDVLVADLGIDSLMGMEVAEEISNLFSVKVGIAEFAAATDLGSLCKLIADNTTGFSYDSEAGSRTQSDVLDIAESSAGPLTSATSDTELFSDEEESKPVYRSFSHPRSIEESLNAVLKAFDIIREEFDVFAKETGCDKFWSQVYPPQASLIVAYITEAFAKLGCDLSSVKAGEKIPNVPHSPKHDKLMIQLMRALRDDGLITLADNDWIRTLKPITVQLSSPKRFDQILADFPQFTPEHKLLHVVGSKLDECLCGKLNPISLLFGSPEKRKLMADQYLIAPIQSSVSQQLGRFIKQCFGSQAIQQALRVLEIGGGTCGTSLHAVNAFAQLRIPVEYTFSDISPSFITAAKSKLGEHKFVNFRTLDITEDPCLDLRDYYDMIIATNVIHATPDACKSARNARQMLRPGGFLTLIEYTRSTYLLDVIYGQLDGWWLFDDGRDHAIVDESRWKTVLKRAGFEKIDWTGGQNQESEILRIFLAY
jgi:acyl transferase domain-containing protein/SAM-dependent methyltransferase/acyl carrier protein